MGWWEGEWGARGQATKEPKYYGDIDSCFLLLLQALVAAAEGAGVVQPGVRMGPNTDSWGTLFTVLTESPWFEDAPPGSSGVPKGAT